LSPKDDRRNRSGNADKSPVVIPEKSSRVFVGRLTRNVTKEHITEIFSVYGAIRSVDFPLDPIHTSFNKGFAYIEFEKAEDAENSCKFMDGGQIDGQECKVTVTQPLPPQTNRSRYNENTNRGRNDGYRSGRYSPQRRGYSPQRRTDRRSPMRRDRRSPINGGGGGASSSATNGRRRTRSPKNDDKKKNKRQSSSSSDSSREMK
jgi:RNA-binding protein with serine-rich domain 1